MQYDTASNGSLKKQSNILTHFGEFNFDLLSPDPIKKDYGEKNSPIYLQQGTHIQQYQPSHIVIPHSTTTTNINRNCSITCDAITIASTSPPPTPPPSTISFKNHDLEDAKRASHLISEQRRRNTIRLGFKELTEIIPTLKNINNSKSTILFKAVEFIKHLDRRNRSLQDKLSSLQLRLQVEKSVKKTHLNHHHPTIKNNHLSLPPDTISALIAHKNQQKQLEELQYQLLKKSPYHSISIPTTVKGNENLHTTSTLIVPHDDDDLHLFK